MLSKSKILFFFGALFSFQVLASGTVLIDGKDIKSRDSLHHLIAKKLNFTQGYTKSSESLYDILSSDFRGDSIIKFKHLSILKAKLGTDYIENFVQAIENASVDNNRIVLLLE
ncbi:MAG: barstar family protein [Bacteriovorax sp.]|nr:barstar family protein [Bacteriovorax sp.]